MTGKYSSPLYNDQKKCLFVSDMSFKYINASYSVFSYAVRRFVGIFLSPPLPPAISVELSSKCNLGCPECFTGARLLRRRSEFMSYDLASVIASVFRGRALSAWLSFQGEPLMHPQFFQIAELFAGMNQVISTNGHYLDSETCTRLAESSLKEIIISYDGVTPEAYSLYRRGGDHSRVTEGIIMLAGMAGKRRSAPKITLQFLLHRGNEHEAGEAAAFAASIGAGFRIKSIQVLNNDRAAEWIPADQRRSRYINSDGQWKIAGVPERGCIRMWTTAVITTDGDVVPCCYDKNASHAMGNLHNQSFSDIWQGQRYRLFRDAVMTSRSMIDICSQCPQGRRIFFKR
jgi:radical SAM protein with 4Fe4S-binding SPASM domain